MQPEIKVEELESTRRRIAVEVSVEEVQSEMDRAFGRVQQQAKLKGFRPGKAPRAVLERYFGDQVRADVLSHLIEHSFAEAVAQAGLRAVGPPEIVPDSIEPGKPLRYTATLDVLPPIAILEHEGLPAKRSRRSVTEADIDGALDHLRESLGELRPVEGRDEARVGDFASIDYVASVNGKPLPNGSRQNRLVQVGQRSVPPEIDQALAGAKIGRPAPVDVVFPAEHPDQALAGQTVRFEVTLRAIREKLLPPADDDLAKEHGECATLAELRAKLHGRIAESLAHEAESEVHEQLVAELLKRNSFDVPRSMIERQTDGLVEEFLERLGPQRADFEKDAARIAKLREDARPRAEQQVRALLALDALAAVRGLTASEDDVESRIGEMARQAGDRAQKLLELYRDPRLRAELAGRMRRERALDALVRSARIEEIDAAPRVVAPVVENG